MTLKDIASKVGGFITSATPPGMVFNAVRSVPASFTQPLQARAIATTNLARNYLQQPLSPQVQSFVNRPVVNKFLQSGIQMQRNSNVPSPVLQDVGSFFRVPQPITNKVSQYVAPLPFIGRNPLIESVQNAAANTKVSPIGITPKMMMNLRTPLGDISRSIPQPIKTGIPLLQLPEQIEGGINFVGRMSGLQPSALDLAISGLSVYGAPIASQIVKKYGNAGKIFNANRQLIADVTSGRGTPEQIRQFEILNRTGRTAEAARTPGGINIQAPRTGKMWDILREMFPDVYYPSRTGTPRKAPTMLPEGQIPQEQRIVPKGMRGGFIDPNAKITPVAQQLIETRQMLQKKWDTATGGMRVAIGKQLTKLNDQIGMELKKVTTGNTQAVSSTPITKVDPTQLVKTDPILNMKRDVPVTDIHGQKAVIPQGEALTPYEIKGGKVLLKDGQEYLISKNQYENVKGQAVKAEAKPFSPELAQTEELVNGYTPKIPVTSLPENYTVSQYDSSGWWTVKDPNGWTLTTKPTKEEATQMAIELLDIKSGASRRLPKFEQYTLPGGENYREVLVKAPKEQTNIPLLDELDKIAQDNFGTTYRKLDSEQSVGGSEMRRKIREIYGKQNGISEDAVLHKYLDQKDLVRKNQFIGSHWDEPNVITHLRFNNRTTPDGKKVTFMEELQSDWARESRKNRPSIEESKKKLDDIKNKIAEKTKEHTVYKEKLREFQNRSDQEEWSKKNNATFYETLDHFGFRKIYDKWDALSGELTQLNHELSNASFQLNNAIPSHPLLKNWQELAVKRALQEAVKDGSEYLSWTTGEQQKARYQLSKQVESIKWEKQATNNNVRAVFIKPVSGDNIMLLVGVDDGIVISAPGKMNAIGKPLSEVIGKGISDKVMSGESGNLSGEGLNIGGEWANTLYDKQVKNIVEDLTGGKVETLDLKLPKDAKGSDTWSIDNPGGDFGNTPLTADKIKEGLSIGGSDRGGPAKHYIIIKNLGNGKFSAIQKNQLAKEDIDKIINGTLSEEERDIIESNENGLIKNFNIPTEPTTQQAIKITPEIRSKILGEAPKLKQPSGVSPFEEKKKEIVSTPGAQQISMDKLVSHEGAPDRKQVDTYKEKIKNGEYVEPLKIIKEGEKYGIEDGKHRYQAMIELGYKSAPVQDVSKLQKYRMMSGNIDLNAKIEWPWSKIGQQRKEVAVEQSPVSSGASIPQNRSLITPEMAKQIPIDPVQRILYALKGAKILRGKQEDIYRKIRSQQAAKIVAMGSKVPGEAGFHAQLGQLKGEMPKVQFEGIRDVVTQPVIDQLFQKVEESTLSPFEKITAKSGLAKLLGAEGGQVPVQSELKLLNEVFPPEFIEAILDKRPMMERVWSMGESLLNLPRSIMSTADLSAPFRQGIFLIGRPKQWGPAFADMFKYAFNQKAYDGLFEQIKKRPTYDLMKENHLALTDLGSNLTTREEQFMSDLLEKIPLFGKVAKGSERAYVGFLNKLRADTFDSLLNDAKSIGLDVNEVASSIARFVNSATGRGELPGMLNRASSALNGLFFSPRLIASRLNLLNPIFYGTLHPFVRKEALKSLFAFASAGLTILGLAKLAGAEVGVDPRSADFGKIKIGNTRYDIWGGFQQYIVLASRLITNQMVSSTSGKEFTLGTGYKPTTRFDIIQRFFESKEAPVASFVTALLKGQTAVGEKVSVPVEIIDRLIPMGMQDMYDLYREYGIPGLAMAIPGIFGFGSQTYTDQIPMAGKTPTGKPNVQWRQAPGLGETILNKITGNSVSNIPEDQWGKLIEEKKAKTQWDIDLGAVKAKVLESETPQTITNPITNKRILVYLDNGIVKTKEVSPKKIKIKKAKTIKLKSAKKVSISKSKKLKLSLPKTKKIKTLKIASSSVRKQKSPLSVYIKKSKPIVYKRIKGLTNSVKLV